LTGAEANSVLRTSSRSIRVRIITTVVTAGLTTFADACVRSFSLPDSIVAGTTTNKPKVTTVMATAAMPKTARGIDDWKRFMVGLLMLFAGLSSDAVGLHRRQTR
jgi:hypothetical protein